LEERGSGLRSAAFCFGLGGSNHVHAPKPRLRSGERAVSFHLRLWRKTRLTLQEPKTA
jgi:hypothetical protein